MSDLFAPPQVDLTEDNRAARRAEVKRRKRRRSTITLVVALAIAGMAAAYVWQNVLPEIFAEDQGTDEVTDFPGPGQGSVQVVVSPGDSGTAIGRTLVDAGVVATLEAFTSAHAANSAASTIQPGTYTLMMQMSAADAVTALLDSANRVQVRLTVQEGLRIEQTYDRIASVLAVDVSEVEAAAQDTEALGLPAEAGGNLEGWLFPETYFFEPGTDAQAILIRMIQQTVSVLDELGVPVEDRQTLLIKASIVEKESRLAEDRGKVARVIENRLAAGLALQMDSTVNYALDRSSITTTLEDLEIDSPYNTYLNAGLPPAPIASPGKAAIQAALSPTEGPWYFFVTINPDTGETLFAETYAEHLANTEFFRQWQAQQDAAPSAEAEDGTTEGEDQ